MPDYKDCKVRATYGIDNNLIITQICSIPLSQDNFSKISFALKQYKSDDYNSDNM